MRRFASVYISMKCPFSSSQLILVVLFFWGRTSDFTIRKQKIIQDNYNLILIYLIIVSQFHGQCMLFCFAFFFLSEKRMFNLCTFEFLPFKSLFCLYNFFHLIRQSFFHFIAFYIVYRFGFHLSQNGRHAVKKNNKNKSIFLFISETTFGNLLVLLFLFTCDCEMNEINHLTG